jgi:hypothetical protein
MIYSVFKNRPLKSGDEYAILSQSTGRKLWFTVKRIQDVLVIGSSGRKGDGEYHHHHNVIVDTKRKK